MKKLFVFTALLCVLVNCKKKNETPETDPQPAATSTTGTTGSNPVTPVATTSVNGMLTVTQQTSTLFGQNSIGTNLSAYFSAKPTLAPLSSNGLRMKTVAVDGDSLNFFSITNSYSDFRQAVLSTPTWDVVGTAGFPSFSLPSPVQIPGSDDLQVLPATISKSAGFSINVNNVSGITSGIVGLSTLSSTMVPVFQSLALGNNQVKFTPAQLAAIPTGSCIGMIVLENAKIVSVEGKLFRFNGQKSISREIMVTN